MLDICNLANVDEFRLQMGAEEQRWWSLVWLAELVVVWLGLWLRSWLPRLCFQEALVLIPLPRCPWLSRL